MIRAAEREGFNRLGNRGLPSRDGLSAELPTSVDSLIGRAARGNRRAGDGARERCPGAGEAGRRVRHVVRRRGHAGGERWERRNGEPVHIITDMRVPEASVVAFPCYEQTDAQVAERALRRSR